MGYQALYRVWRPQSFQDVVGQEHITKTLQNALLQQKFSHAYLFSGPRGTGKTSAAKIFAKAVNCETPIDGEPCNECASCRGITDGSIQDVIEIDAASNNGVDEIRDIRDKVKFAPSAVRFKVYIIDEVHMLSIGAFNALLKTLEEPPKHVIFILATTEMHKIPLTIISRCQRFEFRRMSTDGSIGRMRQILQANNLQYEEQALLAIARAADGGMRDALSLLDQAISFSDDAVRLEDVLAITGAASQEQLVRLVVAMMEQNDVEALLAFQQLMDQGKDPVRLVEDLMLFCRDVLLYQTSPQMEAMFERAIVDDSFQRLATDANERQLYAFIELLNKSQSEMKFTNHPRIYLEVTIMQSCQIDKPIAPSGGASVDLQPLLNKIQQLEQQLQQLQVNGVPQAAQQAKPKQPTPQRNSYKAPIGKIFDVLKHATRPNIDWLRNHWPAVMETLRQQGKASLAALFHDSEAVAASDDAFVVKFKYEIHCQMAAEQANVQFFQHVFTTATGRTMQMVGVPDSQWLEVREQFLQTQQQQSPNAEVAQEADPLVEKAIELAGEQYVEIRND